MLSIKAESNKHKVIIAIISNYKMSKISSDTWIYFAEKEIKRKKRGSRKNIRIFRFILINKFTPESTCNRQAITPISVRIWRSKNFMIFFNKYAVKNKKKKFISALKHSNEKWISNNFGTCLIDEASAFLCFKSAYLLALCCSLFSFLSFGS